MIKADELRLVSWVASNKHNGLYTQIFSILGSKSIKLGLNPIAVYSIDDISGIPITEELLLKAGFTTPEHFTITNCYSISLGRNRFLSVSCVGTPNLMVWLCSREQDEIKYSDLICLHNWDYDKELYLHRLMNIYNLLTGDELNIKL